MPSTRLFHTLVIAGAALVSAPLVACGGSTGTEPSTLSQGSQPQDDDDDIDLGKPVGKPVDGKVDSGVKPAADAGAPDTGWAPTK
jgi:hypothetical protein